MSSDAPDRPKLPIGGEIEVNESTVLDYNAEADLTLRITISLPFFGRPSQIAGETKSILKFLALQGWQAHGDVLVDVRKPERCT